MGHTFAASAPADCVMLIRARVLSKSYTGFRVQGPGAAHLDDGESERLVQRTMSEDVVGGEGVQGLGFRVRVRV